MVFIFVVIFMSGAIFIVVFPAMYLSFSFSFCPVNKPFYRYFLISNIAFYTSLFFSVNWSFFPQYFFILFCSIYFSGALRPISRLNIFGIAKSSFTFGLWHHYIVNFGFFICTALEHFCDFDVFLFLISDSLAVILFRTFLMHIFCPDLLC